MVHYGMTKTAQLSVMRGLAKTLRGTGVNVNAVLPGPTWTEGVAEFVAQLAEDEGLSAEEMRKQFIPRFRPDSMIERFIEPMEIAAMVAYAVSSVSSGPLCVLKGDWSTIWVRLPPFVEIASSRGHT